MKSNTIRCILIFTTVILATIYVIADFSVVLDLFRLSTIPSALQPHHTAVYWNDARRSAICLFILRTLLGGIGVISLAMLVSGQYMAFMYRRIVALIPHAREPIKVAAFWAWWTLLSYLLDLVGLNLGGWRLDRPFNIRPFWEVPIIVLWEVGMALLFWLLARRVKSRIVAIIIFAGVGIFGWLIPYEFEVRSCASTPQLLQGLSPSQAKPLESLLHAESINPEMVRAAKNIMGTAYLPGVTASYLLFNPYISYDVFEQSEAILLQGIGAYQSRLLAISLFGSNFSYYFLRSVLAFLVVRTESLMLAMGFPPDITIGALAIGDFLMTSVRHGLEPLWAALNRAAEWQGDQLAVKRGRGEDLRPALLKAMEVLQYDLNPFFIFLSSPNRSTKNRIQDLS